MGQKNLAVLTRAFLQEIVWRFCQAAEKSGRNNEVALRRGFTVTIESGTQTTHTLCLISQHTQSSILNNSKFKS